MSAIVDLDDALERVQNDKVLLHELMDDFVKDYDKKRKLIDKVIERKDFKKIKELFHSLKGGAGNISARTLFECFMLTEQMLVANEEIDIIKEILVDIEKQMEELKIFTNQFKKEIPRR